MAPGRSYLSAALAIVLASEQLQSIVNAQQTFVCGNTYQDASLNCTVNPACPSGNAAQDCEPEGYKQCYVMPADACFSPPTRAPVTDSPTLSPIPAPLKVCAGSYEEAVENCLTNDSCDENSCALGQACFDVAVDLCGTLAPTPEPTPSSYKVCGANSFESEANCLDMSKRCPTGAAAECGPTEACFNVPANVCGVTQGPSTSPVASGNSEETSVPTRLPTSAPTIMVVPTAPTMPPTPQFIAVCGTDPNDAQMNICTNPRCPTGDNCAVGGCYAFAYQECPDVVPTTDAPSTPPLPPTPPAPPSPEPSVSPVTPSPTASPVYNRFFCGATFQLAEANCWTADTCSTVKACTKPGEQCFGIQSERCNSPAPTDKPTTSPVSGPQPTDSPTTSSAPTMKPVTGTPTIQPSPVPSKSPVVNKNFCGATYGQAEQNCSSLTACPSGTCPSGMTCYAGITCATESESTTMATTTVPDTTTTATTTNPTTTDSPDGGFTTTVAPALQYEKYCGTNLQNAMAFCSFAKPCNTTDDCTSSQSCFSIPVACGTSEGPILTPPGPTPTNPPTEPAFWTPPTPPPSAAVTTPGPTAKPVGFDPNNTLFCGKDYEDAVANCFTNTPCPSEDPATCPSGESCFPITSCETPPPTTSPSPTLAGGRGATMSPTRSPTKRPTTPQPTYNWDPAPSSAPKSKILGFVANSIVVGGAILGVMFL